MLQKKESKNKIKVGVFVPQSPAYPSASLNFVDGIKLYFTLFENSFPRGAVELEIIDIGSGSASKVKEKAQALLMNFRPDFILGYMNSSIGIELANMVNAFDIPVLISNLGENAVEPSEIPENLFFNTFQFWQSYFHLGRYLSSKFESDWLIISSLHDTGYDPLRAFRLGLKSNYANIAQEIYLNAHTASELIEEFNNQFKGVNKLIPAVFFPPNLLEPVIEELGSKFDKVISTPFFKSDNDTIKYWAIPHGQLNVTEPKIVKGAQEYLETTPDLFHMLGYRAGGMLYEAASKLEDPGYDYQNILNAWKNFEFKVSSEFFSVDAKTSELCGLSNVFKGTSPQGSYELIHSVHSNKIDDSVWEEMTEQRSAFINPYMFY
ncbi:ABC transporter substrate-binding protein [Marivirga tractuosa]|uniref:ABC transporter substrate-binding protein n=1 Tax=Marivirga tractuosa TaxID=1006 RepID=UPI0035D10355